MANIYYTPLLVYNYLSKVVYILSILSLYSYSSPTYLIIGGMMKNGKYTDVKKKGIL